MSNNSLEKNKSTKNSIFEYMLSIDDPYKEDTKAFINFLTENRLDISFESVKAYVDFLDQPHNGKKYSASTFNKRIAGVKKRIKDLFEKSPDSMDLNKRLKLERELDKIKLKKINSHAIKKDKILSLEEIDLLITRMMENPFPGAKSIAYMIKFLYLTGVRVSEMLSVVIASIKRNNGHLIIKIDGKGSKEREVFISRDFFEELKNYFKGEVYLFEHSNRQFNSKYVTNQIRMGGLLILNKNISAHTLRHCFATHKLKSGKSLKAVSKYLGHASTSITSDLYNHDSFSYDDVEADFYK